MKRQPHWKYHELKIRKAVLIRDNYECQIRGPNCTVTATSVDHIHPKAWGGTAHPSNLRAACKACNQSKGARSEARDERQRRTPFFSDVRHMRAPLANLSPNAGNAVVRRDYTAKPAGRGATES